MKKPFGVAVLAAVFFFSSAVGLMAAGQALTDIQRLGMHLYKDKNLSWYQNQSCQTCHHPLAGFADRSNFLHPYDKFVSLGSDGVSLGGRNAPTSAYAGFSPKRYIDANGEYIGGMFWDSRATGDTLGDPLAEQAQGPPTNPVEMAMPDKRDVIDVILAATYYPLWVTVFGSFTDVTDVTDEEVEAAYDNFGRAIAAYERSGDVTAFSSKYDVARSQFTRAEQRGLALFEANCATCHPTVAANGAPQALFTTHGYVNIGVPANPAVPAPDKGLGAQLELEGVADFAAHNGKFKIPTLRNIAVSAPYSHNGGFPTLYDMVSFINDRSGFTADVPVNVTPLVGDLRLSQAKIDDLIAFLETLTDGY